MRIGVLITIIACFIAGTVTAFLVHGPSLQAITVPGSSRALIGGPFRLVDHTGVIRSNKDYKGKLMLVYFGYTHCPDICPGDLQIMSAALDQLGTRAKNIVPLFITVDPERDTVKQLSGYVSYFHKSLVGLTGSVTDIAAAAKAYRVYYGKVENKENPSNYLMNHSSLIYLMDTEGNYLTHFNHGTPIKKIVERISKYL